MDIVVESTEAFKQDLTGFSEAEQSIILEQIQQGIPLLFGEKISRDKRLHQFESFQLPHNYGSSLYSFRVDYRIRVILSFDEDPIFERTLITLFRAVESQKSSETYKQVGEQIYRQILQSKQPTLAG
ncbi:hypothetical protein ACL6C3_07665 [Capilliphycus salinus ALCB114379]|uniref:hypothetical protein n=1 Tax=Capilliphycus salinus TaxID=2768948 RepID=UPI0039A7652A